MWAKNAQNCTINNACDYWLLPSTMGQDPEKIDFKYIWMMGPFSKWPAQIALYFGYSGDCAELCGFSKTCKNRQKLCFFDKFQHF